MGRGKCSAGASVRRVLCMVVSHSVVISRNGTGLGIRSSMCFVLTVPVFFRRAGTFVIKYVCIVVQI